MFKGKGSFKSFAPVNVGDEINVKIEGVGEKGDGIAKVKGFVIFVPGAKTGEEIKIKVTKVLRKVAFGEVAGAATGEIGSTTSTGAESAEGAEKGSEESTEEESYESSEDESQEE